MKQSIAKLVSKAINTYLSADEESHVRLKKLAGKTILVEILPFHYKFYLICSRKEIKVLSEYSDMPDVTVSGTPLQLLSISLASENRQRFFAEDVSITGDAIVGQQLIELFDHIKIDWTSISANFIGEVPAYHLNKGISRIKQWAATTKSSIGRQLSEYLHEEALLFPPKEEIKDFFNDIDELNMHVERLSAKFG
ncbi:MAG: SCP2 sterol-binding domain-containing protein, partial [Gammaproteobacteria bacterium]|nr:SCP2 sterol-binding domain-containing protein [Gammaproteobacteria bacterium]